jgi:hypothetical protein
MLLNSITLKIEVKVIPVEEHFFPEAGKTYEEVLFPGGGKNH